MWAFLIQWNWETVSLLMTVDIKYERKEDVVFFKNRYTDSNLKKIKFYGGPESPLSVSSL